MKKEYIFFGVLAVIVLYALTKIRQPDVQQVPEFISSGPGPSSDRELANIQAKAGAFGALASVAQTQTQANVAKDTTASQLEATRIGAGMQERLGTFVEQVKQNLGLAQFASQERLQAGQLSAAQVMQDRQLSSAEQIQAGAYDLQRFGISQEVAQYLAGLQSQENLYKLDSANRMATAQQQQAAVERVAREYKGQSLERAGTYLNAILAAGDKQAVYDYQSAFGGPRPPTFLQQLSGLITPAANALKMFL